MPHDSDSDPLDDFSDPVEEEPHDPHADDDVLNVIQSGATLPTPHYVYTRSAGLELLGTRGNTALGNFHPVLIREIELRDGDETKREYDVRFTLSVDFFVDVRLRAQDIESDRTLRKRLIEQLPIGKFIVYPSGWAHILPAIGELSQLTGYAKETAYASMGWVSTDPMVYLLPSSKGIGKNGVIDEVVMDDASVDALPPSWRNYGREFKPPTATELPMVEEALTSALKLSPIMIVAITQVLGGALSSFGARQTPPLVHLLGETGSFKTTLSLIAMSCMGVFDGESAVTETWTSTQNSLMAALHDVKDVTLLIDDYKRTRSGTEPTTLIQNYADSTTRSRMSSDQSRRRSLLPRGLLISTGEDVWEAYQSVGARTIAILVKRPDDNDLPNFMAAMAEVQGYAANGVLAMVGALWVQWLANHHPTYIENFYKDAREIALTSVHTAHLRLTATLASLAAVSAVVEAFLADAMPNVLPVYQLARTDVWDTLAADAMVQSEEAATLSPYAWAIAEISQALSGGTIHFIHKSSKVTATLGSQNAKDKAISKFVGYYDDQNIYLTRQTTYDWLLYKAGMSRRDIHFSWNGFLQGAKNRLGPFLDSNGSDVRISYLSKMHGKVQRSLVIPITEVMEVTPDPTQLNDSDVEIELDVL